MERVKKALESSIGLKAIMALTGIALLGFVVVHMLGNLQIFAGQDAINTYAHKLKSLGPLLWVARLGLLGIFVVHIGAAMKLTKGNEDARKTRYAYEAKNGPHAVQASWASRYMLVTGGVVAAFVVFHLVHFTVPSPLNEEALKVTDHAGHHDVFSMVVTAFKNPLFVAFYVVANLVLGVHLAHGVSSVFQTLGLRHERYDLLIKMAGPGLATLIAIGNIGIPLYIFFFFPSLTS